MDRMKQAVARTRSGLQERMDDLLTLARPVDESALEELEGTLIASDIGVATSQEIIDRLRQQASRHGASVQAHTSEIEAAPKTMGGMIKKIVKALFGFGK